MSKLSADEAGLHAWARFLATHAELVERIESALAEASLPPLGWYDVLWALETADGGRLRMHELAHAVVLSRSNLTRLIDRLEAGGLTARERCDDDRRGSFASITTAGRAMRKRMWPVYRKQIEALFAVHLSVKEAQALSSVFTRMLKASRERTTVAS
ncbi:MAG: MarR family transcriptional regulator [Betaproteobacteria bacterium]